MPTHTPPATPAERSWHIACRLQEFRAEARVNLLRVVSIALFYLAELALYHGFSWGAWELAPVEHFARFHQAVTALVVAWTALSLGVLICLQRRIFPAWLKYATTAADLLLLTAMLTVASGPKSPLVWAYFLIIAMAALRFRSRLVWFGALGAVAGYLFLLGYAHWAAPELRVDRYAQLLTLLSLALAGVVLGQLVRQARRLAETYHDRGLALTSTD